VDIAILGENSLRLKGKKVAFVIDPEKGMPKTSADAVILLNDGNNNVDISRVTDSRIIIAGPGSYEVEGIKISGLKTPKGIVYRILIDDIITILGSSTDTKVEGYDVCQVAIINTTNDFSESYVTALEPKITVLYGDKKEESAKKLGAESVNMVPKVTILKDKLPEEMEIAVLG
jgi:hypothetical protein